MHCTVQASQNIDLSDCFRQVTRMAEANVEPPESALDESGSGEDQKEEKQDEEEEGDRAFEVELCISLHATYHWRSCGLSPTIICKFHHHSHHHHFKCHNQMTSIQCNICLDTARDAVVSMCGHLFCWPCLHQVALTYNQCPCPPMKVVREML